MLELMLSFFCGYSLVGTSAMQLQSLYVRHHMDLEINKMTVYLCLQYANLCLSLD